MKKRFKRLLSPPVVPSLSPAFAGASLSVVLLLSLPLAAVNTAGASRTGGHPNILLILADDMGYGDPQCFNPQSKISTPNIDQLAREGMRFTDAHAAGPLCHPSRYGLMTGRYPFRADIGRWREHPLISGRQATIATVLKAQGYKTAMVGRWHLGFEEKGYDQPLVGGPLDHGFDTFLGTRASTDIPPYFWIRADRAVLEPTGHIAERHTDGWASTQGAFLREGGIAPDYAHTNVLPRLADEAVTLIRSHRGAAMPLFLYVAWTAPHTPWLPAPEFVGKSGAGMYGDFVQMVDAEIGRVIKALEEADMAQETLVVFTSDNGPVWRPADVKKFGHDAAGGLRGMKSDAWEGGHRMPFVVRWPGKVKPGSVSQQTICFTDLMGTFAEVCGVTLESGAGPDSFSFLPVLLGRQAEKQPIRGPIVMQAGSTDAMMIRSGDWKLINQLGSGGFTTPNKIPPDPGGPEGQLYHLRKDPAEARNCYLEHPEVVIRLKAELEHIVEAPVPGKTRKQTAQKQ